MSLGLCEELSKGGDIVRVLVVMGSDSDWPTMREAARVLRDFGVEYEVRVCSAHRTPEAAAALARGAREAGFGVIIAGAGMAAHLPGVVAAYTTLPVIGVPLRGGIGDGVDALYSIVQMPPGIPVACVGVGAARNAALLALEILSLSREDLRERLEAYRKDMARKVAEKDERVRGEALD